MARRRNEGKRAAKTGGSPLATEAAPARWPAAAFGVLLAGALASKIGVLASLGGHPLLQPAGEIDGGVYARLARRIVEGDLLLRGEGPVPYFVSPLYAYFLAACGASWPVARVVQILLGTLAVALVFLAARRLFGERAALAAGVLYALAGVVTFHEVVILQAALDPILTALFLYLIAVGLGKTGIASKVWVGAGAAGGLLALNRPNALLCVVAIAAALSLFTFKAVSLRTLLPALTLLAGTALALAPCALRNLVVSHEFVLISSHGGLNFLVGNNPEATGLYRALPGITPDIGGQREDSKKVAEAAAGRSLSSREISSHFAGEAWTWIGRNPGAALSLFLRKIRLLLSSDEAPLNFSYPWYRERSAILKALFVGTGLLVPLGAAGFVLGALGFARASRGALFAWAAFAPAYVVAVAAFFVATRYRIPLLVALAPLAGNALAAVPEAWRARRMGALAAAGATAALLAVLCLTPTGLYDGSADEDMHWALFLVEKGDLEGAARAADAAALRHPDPGTLWFRMGQAWAAAQRMDEAIAALEKANALELHPPATSRALAGAHESRAVDRILAHDTTGALPDLERAAALAPEEPGILLNLAAALAETGDRARARQLAQKSLALRPGYEKAEALLKALR